MERVLVQQTKQFNFISGDERAISTLGNDGVNTNLTA